MININHSHWFINSSLIVQDDFTRKQTVEPLLDTDVLNDVRKQTLLLPYAGQNGCTLVKSLKTHLKKTFPLNERQILLHRQLNYHENFTWKIKHLLKKSMIFSTELFVLPTTALKIMLGRLPDS